MYLVLFVPPRGSCGLNFDLKTRHLAQCLFEYEYVPYFVVCEDVSDEESSSGGAVSRH